MKKNMNPHITILMAVYNGQKYLSQMIDSIIEQDYENWTLVISDDGSTDGTLNIVEEYVKKYPKKIKRYVSGQKFGGASKHFMHLLENVRDDYVMFCDQDDIWHKNKLSLTMHKMLETERKSDLPVLVHTDLCVTDENMNVISSSFFKYSAIQTANTEIGRIIMQNIVTGCTVMINAQLAELAVLCKNPENIIMHDWWIALCASAFGEIAVVYEATIDYRQHGDNSVGAKNVYSIRYIANKIFGGNIKTAIMNSARQGALLGETFGERLDNGKRETVCACAEIKTANKIQRLRLYTKYKLMPCGILRKMKMFVWG